MRRFHDVGSRVDSSSALSRFGGRDVRLFKAVAISSMSSIVRGDLLAEGGGA